MKRQTGIFGIAVVAVTTTALAACSSSSGGGGSTGGGAGTAASGGTYKIGLMNNSGGAFATQNKTAVAGALYAVKVINDAGGVNGAKLEVTSTVDTQGEPKNGTTLVPKLAQQDILAIVGPVDSGTVEIAYTVAKQLKIPAVSPGAGRPGVLDASRPYGFTLAEADIDVSTPALTEIIKAKGFKTAAIIGDNVTAATKTQIPLLQTVFDATAVKVVSNVSFKAGDSSFASQVTAMGSANPDLIGLAAGPEDAGRIAREVRSQGLKSILIGSSSLQAGGAAFAKAGGDAAEGTLAAAQYDPTNPAEPAKTLLAAAQKDTGLNEIPLNYAYAYDAVNMVVEAIKTAGIKPGDDVASSREKLLAGIAGIKSYDGMAGKTSFKENGTGDRPSLKAVMQGNQFHIEH